VTEDLKKETSSRKRAEKQRDDLLDEIAKNGNVTAMASIVNSQLDEIRKIGFKK